MSHALGTLTSFLLLALGTAQARTVVVVLDRSGSLRYADPEGAGPRQLAVALALALEEGDRLELLPTRGAATPRQFDSPAALEGLLRDLVGSEPPQGGADLLGTLLAARGRAGADGLVVVFSDDDLDVTGTGEELPQEVVRRATQAGKGPPTRDDLNDAARALLVEGWPAGPALVALRAQLPGPARATPFLEAVGATVIDLEPGLAGAAALVAAIRGDPLLAEARQVSGESLDLPYPARAVLVGERPWTTQGTRLDEAGRVWLVEGAPLPLGPAPPGTMAWIAPRLALPSGVIGFKLRDGSARVVLPQADPGPGGIAVRAGEDEVLLTGSPLQALLPLDKDTNQVTLLRVLDGQSGRVVTARRVLPLARAELSLSAVGQARVGQTLTLRGQLPPGYPPPAELPIRVREGLGGTRALTLKPGEPGEMRVSFPSRVEGPLEVESSGELFVSLAGQVDVVGGTRFKLSIARILGPNGAELSGPLEVKEERTKLQVVLQVEPPLDAPIEIAFELSRAPEGAAIEAQGPVTVQDQVTVPITLAWPLRETEVITIRAGSTQDDGPRLRASRPLAVRGPSDPLRRGAAIAVLVLSAVWFLWLLRRHKARRVALALLVGDKQLRGIGPNGKISVERYFLREFLPEDGPVSEFTVGPMDGGATIEVEIRQDGTIKASAVEGQQLVHADRPELLVKEITLRHGNALAIVSGNVARRYVYLEHEATGDDLQTRFVEGTVSYEAELRDSGVFVVLDDEENVPAGSDHDLTVSQELFVSHESLPSPSPEEETVNPIPVVPSSADGSVISDEGILYMDSTEADILDSDDQLFLSGERKVGKDPEE